jgi:6-phosphogluconolactonase (cycloisomerase 2 family)
LITTALLALLVGGPATAAGGAVGAVYVASNDPTGNEILVFQRSAQGDLSPAMKIATGGNGTGGGLGNQGGVVLSDDERFLYAVNAGSDSVSAFAAEVGGLRLIDTIPSGGARPVSIAIDRDLLYVVNAGGAVGSDDNVSGFRVRRDGSLESITGSTRALSAQSTGPAQAGFTKNGRFLLVTEKATNTITVFTVRSDGTLEVGQPQPSVGATPFGFDVDLRSRVFVSEAFGGAPGGSAVSAYAVHGDGQLSVIDPSEPTTETAACWFAIGNDGRFGYTTNTGSGTLTGFAIERDGSLRLLDPDGVTAASEGGPIDLAFSRDGRYLFVLRGSGRALSAFRVDGGDGSLESIGAIDGLPASANGLAAR